MRFLRTGGYMLEERGGCDVGNVGHCARGRLGERVDLMRGGLVARDGVGHPRFDEPLERVEDRREVALL